MTYISGGQRVQPLLLLHQFVWHEPILCIYQVLLPLRVLCRVGLLLAVLEASWVLLGTVERLVAVRRGRVYLGLLALI